MDFLIFCSFSLYSIRWFDLEYLPFISIISFTMFVFVFASQTSMSLFWHSSKRVLVSGKFRFFTCATAVVTAAKIPKKKFNIFPVNGNTQRPCTFSQENLFLFFFSFFFSLDSSLYRIVCVYYVQTVHCEFSVSSSVCVAFVVVVSIFFIQNSVFYRIHKNM